MSGTIAFPRHHCYFLMLLFFPHHIAPSRWSYHCPRRHGDLRQSWTESYPYGTHILFPRFQAVLLGPRGLTKICLSSFSFPDFNISSYLVLSSILAFVPGMLLLGQLSGLVSLSTAGQLHWVIRHS